MAEPRRKRTEISGVASVGASVPSVACAFRQRPSWSCGSDSSSVVRSPAFGSPIGGRGAMKSSTESAMSGAVSVGQASAMLSGSSAKRRPGVVVSTAVRMPAVAVKDTTTPAASSQGFSGRAKPRRRTRRVEGWCKRMDGTPGRNGTQLTGGTADCSGTLVDNAPVRLPPG